MNGVNDIEYWKEYATKLYVENVNLLITIRELSKIIALVDKQEKAYSTKKEDE